MNARWHSSGIVVPPRDLSAGSEGVVFAATGRAAEEGAWDLRWTYCSPPQGDVRTYPGDCVGRQSAALAVSLVGPGSLWHRWASAHVCVIVCLASPFFQ